MAKGGFTVLEVLLAVALIGLLSAVLVGYSSRMLDDRPTSPEDVFWQASHEARRTALKSGGDVRLSFDGKSKAFVVDGGAAAINFPVLGADGDLGVDFVPSQGGSSSALIGGTLVETRSIPYATFYSDGTCVPFRVQFRDRRGAHKVEIDPWTGARMLPPLDANGAPVTAP